MRRLKVEPSRTSGSTIDRQNTRQLKIKDISNFPLVLRALGVQFILIFSVAPCLRGEENFRGENT